MKVLDASRSNSATRFINERIFIDVSPRYRALGAFGDGGEVLGVVAFNFWVGRSVHVHIAADEPRCVLPLFRAGVRYVFGTLNLESAIAVVDDGDRSHLLAECFDFVEMGRSAGVSTAGKDVIYLELRRENCPYFQRMAKHMKRAA